MKAEWTGTDWGCGMNGFERRRPARARRQTTEDETLRAEETGLFGAIRRGLLASGIFLLFTPWVVRTITEHTGRLATVTATHLYVAATAVLLVNLLLAVFSGAVRLSLFRGGLGRWYVYLWAWGLWMVVWGVLQGAPALFLLAETCALLLFLVGVAAGISLANWPLIDRMYALGVGILGIPVVIVGVATASSIDPETLKRSMVYSAATILVPSAFLILVPDRLKSKYTYGLCAAAFAVYGIAQFLFAKRAPLARVLLVFLLAFWIIPGWRRRNRLATRAKGISLLAVGIAVIGVMVGGAGWDAVAIRFEKVTGLATAVAGTDETLTMQSEEIDNETYRFREVANFFEGMSAVELLVGKGLGVFTRHPAFEGGWTPRLTGGVEYIQGRSVGHIGMFWAFLKGGGPYFVVFYAGILGLLRRRKECLRSALKTNAWAFVAVLFVFSTIEGYWMQSGSEAVTFLVGASVGVLARREAR